MYVGKEGFEMSSLYRHFLKPLQQRTDKINVANVGNSQNEQTLLFPQCFQLFSVFIHPFTEGFPYFLQNDFSRLLQICCIMGKG